MTRWRAVAALALLGALPWGAAQAVTLNLPAGAVETGTGGPDARSDAARIATGPAVEGAVPLLEAEGSVTRRTWRLPGIDSTLDVIAPLRAQLLEAGFGLLLDCGTEACGGFDFRFAIAVAPEPDMHVDLGDFHYLSAETADEVVSLLVSRRGDAGYLQLVAVRKGLPTAPSEAPGISVSPGATADGIGFARGKLAEALLGQGHVVLDDLDFATGSSDLGAGPYASLTELAAFLKAGPARRVSIVGHTDATGGLDVNMAVSRRRAASVVRRLTSEHGVPAAQLSAEGIGYLAPRAANSDEAGRRANRRVEAVLTSIE